MSELRWTGKEAQQLRALGHGLKPLIQVGKEGVTPALLAALDSALTSHELVKVRVLREAPWDPATGPEALARGTSSRIVQEIGKIVLVYRQRPKKKGAKSKGSTRGAARPSPKVPRGSALPRASTSEESSRGARGPGRTADERGLRHRGRSGPPPRAPRARGETSSDRFEGSRDSRRTRASAASERPVGRDSGRRAAGPFASNSGARRAPRGGRRGGEPGENT